jgi:hypothetical protein
MPRGGASADRRHVPGLRSQGRVLASRCSQGILVESSRRPRACAGLAGRPGPGLGGAAGLRPPQRPDGRGYLVAAEAKGARPRRHADERAPGRLQPGARTLEQEREVHDQRHVPQSDELARGREERRGQYEHNGSRRDRYRQEPAIHRIPARPMGTTVA